MPVKIKKGKIDLTIKDALTILAVVVGVAGNFFAIKYALSSQACDIAELKAEQAKTMTALLEAKFELIRLGAKLDNAVEGNP
jgi:Na+/H+ antiporter NhaB